MAVGPGPRPAVDAEHEGAPGSSGTSGPVAVTVGSTCGASLLTQWHAPCVDQRGHQRRRTGRGRPARGRRSRRCGTPRPGRAPPPRRPAPAARRAGRRRPAAAARPGRSRSRSRSRSRRSSCSGQTRFVSHAIASASVGSSGWRSIAAPPGHLGRRDRLPGTRPVTSQSAAGRDPRSRRRRRSTRRRTSGRGRGTARRSRRPRAAPAAARARPGTGVRVASRPTSLVCVARVEDRGADRAVVTEQRVAAARRTVRGRRRRASARRRRPGWAAA